MHMSSGDAGGSGESGAVRDKAVLITAARGGSTCPRLECGAGPAVDAGVYRLAVQFAALRCSFEFRVSPLAPASAAWLRCGGHTAAPAAPAGPSRAAAAAATAAAAAAATAACGAGSGLPPASSDSDRPLAGAAPHARLTAAEAGAAGSAAVGGGRKITCAASVSLPGAHRHAGCARRARDCLVVGRADGIVNVYTLQRGTAPAAAPIWRRALEFVPAAIAAAEGAAARAGRPRVSCVAAASVEGGSIFSGGSAAAVDADAGGGAGGASPAISFSAVALIGTENGTLNIVALLNLTSRPAPPLDERVGQLQVRQPAFSILHTLSLGNAELSAAWTAFEKGDPACDQRAETAEAGKPVGVATVMRAIVGTSAGAAYLMRHHSGGVGSKTAGRANERPQKRLLWAAGADSPGPVMRIDSRPCLAGGVLVLISAARGFIVLRLARTGWMPTIVYRWPGHESVAPPPPAPPAGAATALQQPFLSSFLTLAALKNGPAAVDAEFSPKCIRVFAVAPDGQPNVVEIVEAPASNECPVFHCTRRLLELPIYPLRVMEAAVVSDNLLLVLVSQDRVVFEDAGLRVAHDARVGLLRVGAADVAGGLCVRPSPAAVPCGLSLVGDASGEHACPQPGPVEGGAHSFNGSSILLGVDYFPDLTDRQAGACDSVPHRLFICKAQSSGPSGHLLLMHASVAQIADVWERRVMGPAWRSERSCGGYGCGPIVFPERVTVEDVARVSRERLVGAAVFTTGGNEPSEQEAEDRSGAKGSDKLNELRKGNGLPDTLASVGAKAATSQSSQELFAEKAALQSFAKRVDSVLASPRVADILASASIATLGAFAQLVRTVDLRDEMAPMHEDGDSGDHSLKFISSLNDSRRILLQYIRAQLDCVCMNISALDAAASAEATRRALGLGAVTTAENVAKPSEELPELTKRQRNPFEVAIAIPHKVAFAHAPCEKTAETLPEALCENKVEFTSSAYPANRCDAVLASAGVREMTSLFPLAEQVFRGSSLDSQKSECRGSENEQRGPAAPADAGHAESLQFEKYLLPCVFAFGEVLAACNDFVTDSGQLVDAQVSGLRLQQCPVRRAFFTSAAQRCCRIFRANPHAAAAAITLCHRVVESGWGSRGLALYYYACCSTFDAQQGMVDWICGGSYRLAGQRVSPVALNARLVFVQHLLRVAAAQDAWGTVCAAFDGSCSPRTQILHIVCQDVQRCHQKLMQTLLMPRLNVLGAEAEETISPRQVLEPLPAAAVEELRPVWKSRAEVALAELALDTLQLGQLVFAKEGFPEALSDGRREGTLDTLLSVAEVAAVWSSLPWPPLEKGSNGFSSCRSTLARAWDSFLHSSGCPAAPCPWTTRRPLRRPLHLGAALDESDLGTELLDYVWAFLTDTGDKHHLEDTIADDTNSTAPEEGTLVTPRLSHFIAWLPENAVALLRLLCVGRSREIRLENAVLAALRVVATAPFQIAERYSRVTGILNHFAVLPNLLSSEQGTMVDPSVKASYELDLLLTALAAEPSEKVRRILFGRPRRPLSAAFVNLSLFQQALRFTRSDARHRKENLASRYAPLIMEARAVENPLLRLLSTLVAMELEKATYQLSTMRNGAAVASVFIEPCYSERLSFGQAIVEVCPNDAKTFKTIPLGSSGQDVSLETDFFWSA